MAGTDRDRLAADGDAAAPAIVLVEPQLGENIGAVARAMLNFGLTDLRLVRPRDGWPNAKAAAAAAGADRVLERARLFERSEDAVADRQRVYAATARPRGMVKPVATPRQAAGDIRRREAQGVPVAILFGGERAGLNNDDIALADVVVTAPLNPGFSSLNLAQAVLLVASEWAQATAPPGEISPASGDSPPASAAQLEAMFLHLERTLDAADFFRAADKRPSMVRAIRTMLRRAGMTEQEVRTMHGIVTALSSMRADGKARFSR